MTTGSLLRWQWVLWEKTAVLLPLQNNTFFWMSKNDYKRCCVQPSSACFQRRGRKGCITWSSFGLLEKTHKVSLGAYYTESTKVMKSSWYCKQNASSQRDTHLLGKNNNSWKTILPWPNYKKKEKDSRARSTLLFKKDVLSTTSDLHCCLILSTVMSACLN